MPAGGVVEIDTPAVYDFLYLDDFNIFVTTVRQMTFSVMAANDAHVALKTQKTNSSNNTYEVCPRSVLQIVSFRSMASNLPEEPSSLCDTLDLGSR